MRNMEQYAKHVNKGRKTMVFEPNDWAHAFKVRKDRFPSERKTKLQARGDNPLQVLEHINDNAYIIDLPLDYGVSVTFNVSDLFFCGAGTIDSNPRTYSFKNEGMMKDYKRMRTLA